MASGSRFFLIILVAVCALCSIHYTTACSCSHDDQYNSAVKIEREAEDGKTAAEHKENTTSLQSPDDRVASSPRIWKSHTGWRYSTFLRHVRGVLNIIGWGTFMPSGVIVARNFREFPMRFDGWYSAHILCQTSGFIMGIVGWAFGISLGKSSKRAHVEFLILGIIIIVLTTIQMSAVFLQPKKESKWRRRWEIWHHLLGYVIIALMIAAIFEGINAQRHAEKWRWVYVGILALLALVAAVLEITRWVKVRRFKRAKDLNANMYSPT